MDDMYSGKISKGNAVERWMAIIARKNIQLRPNHNIECYSYFVYNKEGYSAKQIDKPLGLGIVYTKPNGIKTQDIVIVHPRIGLNIYHKEKKMIEKYPSMKGVHKKTLPL